MMAWVFAAVWLGSGVPQLVGGAHMVKKTWNENSLGSPAG